MDRPARLRVLQADHGSGFELWLIACALVGLICGWIARIDPPERAWAADLAVGRGLPLLADRLGPAHDWRVLKDMADPMALVAAGVVPVAVDASPEGVRILYLGQRRVAARVAPLLAQWPEARVQILRDDPERLLPLLIGLLAFNAGALGVFVRVRRLQSGDWWRWLALQGAWSPEWLVGLLTRQSAGAAALGGVGLLAAFGPTAVIDLGPPVLLLAMAGVGTGLLSSTTRGVAGLVWWAPPQVILLWTLDGPAVADTASILGIWWEAAASIALLVVLMALALRRRLRRWCHGERPS